MEAYDVHTCVIDGLPETHATRDFAKRNRGRAWMAFFNEHQRGALKWEYATQMVSGNRTEALDASRTAIREEKLTLPRRSERLEEFARHLTCDAKILDEDEETGIKKYRYIRTGTNHYSLAFTYAWMAAGRGGKRRGGTRSCRCECQQGSSRTPACSSSSLGCV